LLTTSDHTPEPSPPSPAKAHQWLSRFNIAFSLMSVIPLLICCYLITVKFFSLSILEGLSGFYFLLAVMIAVLGLATGRQVIRDIFQRLVESNAKLERLYRQQGAFVSNVAHEFRSPLTAVNGVLENLSDGVHGRLSAEQQDSILMCRRETERLARLVNDLLDIARIESGKLRLLQQEIVLQEMLRSVTQLFNDRLKERRLQLTMELPTRPITIIADPDRLRQVFINLVANAVKYTEAGGIYVRLTKDPQTVQVDVQDTGRGIAQTDLERIFDKFERVDRRGDEGTGLGLPIARDLIELHQGRLWAESALGKGSRFIVRLPMRPDLASNDREETYA
jgi:signal transduction histidine kinase